MKTLELHYSVIRFLIVIFNIPLFLAGLPQQTAKTRLHILATHLWYGGLLEIISSTSNKMTRFVGQCLHVVQKRPKFTNCTCMKYALDSRYQFNRPFLSCLLRQCQNFFFCARPFIWKCVRLTGSFLRESNSFSYESFAGGLVLKPKHVATLK